MAKRRNERNPVERLPKVRASVSRAFFRVHTEMSLANTPIIMVDTGPGTSYSVLNDTPAMRRSLAQQLRKLADKLDASVKGK